MVKGLKTDQTGTQALDPPAGPRSHSAAEATSLTCSYFVSERHYDLATWTVSAEMFNGKYVRVTILLLSYTAKLNNSVRVT